MDRDDFDRRRTADWFDPAGLFVAEQDGNLVGFHWTKIDQRVGEVYVLAVDPDQPASGVGRALLSRGLEHLAGADVAAIELYVEASSARAVELYTAAGFAEASRDVLYVSRTLATTGRGPS